MKFRDFLILLENLVRYPNITKYHRDLYLPPVAVRDIAGFMNRLPFKLRQSSHWKYERWWKHSYDNISKADLKPGDIFELAYSGGDLVKVGFRVRHLDPEDDIVFIVGSDGKVITTWANKKTDVHKTLDASKYSKSWPPNMPVQ